jgi:WD40 repeat protein
MSFPAWRRLLILTVVSMMVVPGVLAFLPTDGNDATDLGVAVGASDPGRGEGLEPLAITPDPYEDHFRALLPWPTNRTFYGMHWRPGGDYALAVGSGGSLFKFTTGDIEKIPTGTLQSLYDVAWKTDGSEAVIVGNQSTLLLWDASAEDLTKVDVPYIQRFLGVTWDATDTNAIVVGDSGFIGLYNGTGVQSMVTGLPDFIYRVSWRPGGDYAIAVGDSGLIIQVNTSGMMESNRLNTSWGLWRLDWAPDGSYALIAGKNYWFVTPRSLVVRYNVSGTFDAIPVPGDPISGLRGVDFAPSGERAVIAGENSTVLRWGGISLTNLLAPGDRTLRSCTWEGTSTDLLVAGNRGLIMRHSAGGWSNRSYDPRLYNYAIAWRPPNGDYGLVVGRDGSISKVSESGGVSIDSGTDADLYDVDWASDGSYALICGEGGTVLKYDHGGTIATSIKPAAGIMDLHGISVKPGEDVALAVGDAGNVWLWSNNLWTDKKNIGDSRNLRDVAWRPDGEFAMIVGVSGTILNYTTGRVENFQPSLLTWAPLFSVAWNKEGTLAMVVGSKDATSTEDAIYIYDNREWSQVASKTGVTFFGCAFTADGEVGVAFGAPDYIIKFSTRTGDGVRSSFRSPYTLVQRGCMHPTGRSVYFAGSNGYAYRMDVAEFPNSPPVAIIDGPTSGATFDVGSEITFDASSSWDADDDLLTITWMSNVSGFMGQGAVMTTVLDTPGWHRVTVWVDDDMEHNVSEYIIIKLVVPNYPPVPVINSPLEGAVYSSDETIVFDANGSTDPNGDPITYHWVSNVSGDIGYEEHVETTLRVGIHRVILWVEDDKGERTAVFVNITVVQANRPPSVYMTAPLENQRFEPDEEVELNASYSTDPDGDPLTFAWTSSLDGPLGTGAVVHIVLSIGNHVITVTADDGHDHIVATAVNITVEEPPNLPPVITLSGPEANSTVKGVVTISGLASDPEGEFLAVRYAVSRPEDWFPALLEGSSWSISWDTRELLNAQVSVFIEADDGEHTTRIWAQYFVDNPPPENAPPEVTLASPTSGEEVKKGILLEGLASDPDSGVVTKVQVRIDNEAWQDATGTFAWSFYWDTTTVSNGAHTLTVRSFDGEDYSQPVEIEVVVKNPTSDGGDGGSSTTLIVVLVVVVVVVVAAVAYWRLRAPRP